MQKNTTATCYMTGSSKMKSALAPKITALGDVPSQTPIPGRDTNESIIFGVLGTVIAAFGLGLTGCMLCFMCKERKWNAGGERIAIHGLIK
jgi:hypothetical protein